MPILNVNGYGFDCEAFQMRIAAILTANGITTRAQMISVWAGLTTAQQATVISRLILGSISFPGESLTPAQIATASIP